MPLDDAVRIKVNDALSQFSPPKKSASPRSDYAARTTRIEWLRDHHDLWRGRDITRRGVKHDIVTRMKADGVYSPTTYWMDVNLKALIKECLDSMP